MSPATVSRVLNDSPLVVEDTRGRVQAAMDELGYRVNVPARTLSVGRANAIGVVVPFFTTHSAIERLRGVVARLPAGYDLLLFDVEAPGQRAGAMRDFADRNRVAGLIVMSLPVTDEEVDALERDGLPAVLVDVAHPRLGGVLVDNLGGGGLAAEHLLAKGHSRIGFVGDHPTNQYGFTSSEDRRRGFRGALERAGIAPDPALERFGAADRDEAEVLARSLLELPDRPSAIFAASDLQAIGVLQACAALGARVPEDVAVMGFDDVELAEIVGLTTIHQPLRESGELATDLLFDAIARGGHEPVREVQPLTVVERRTT